MPKSSEKSRPRKTPDRPKKPYDGFPLYAHTLGYWSKKIGGKIKHFGRWARVKNGKLEPEPYEASWQEALRAFNARKDEAYAGQIRESVVTPQPNQSSDGVTIQQLANEFLTAMLSRLKTGRKMSQRTFHQYKDTAEWLAQKLKKDTLVANLKPYDFNKLAADLAERYGPVKRGKEVQHVRTMFKWGVDNELIDRMPNFGSDFKKPGRDELRKHRAEGGKKLFTSAEVRQILEGKAVEIAGESKHLAGASTQLKAMILLGINCGFGNTDVASLRKSAIDFDKAVIDFPRPKNGIERRCPLWPETVEALEAAIAERPNPKDTADAGCVFITKWGQRWVRDHEKVETIDGETVTTIVTINSVSLEFTKVLKRLGINGRAGLGFYSLRHTFRTIADATKDFPAVRLIMGHADSSIDAVYREHIEDERLQAVAAHVRGWLLGNG